MKYTDKLGGSGNCPEPEKIIKCNYSVNFCENGCKNKPHFVLLFIETHSQGLYECDRFCQRCKQFVNFRGNRCKKQSRFVLLFIETKNHSGKFNTAGGENHHGCTSL